MENENLQSAQDPDAAAEEQKASEQTGPRMPICPHCNADPFPLSTMQIPAGIGQGFMIFFCRDCRKTINIGVFRSEQPRIVPPWEKR